MKLNERQLKNFFNKIHKTETCWIWIGHKKNRDYGGFQFNRKNLKAHRVSFMFHNNIILNEDQHVCHKCDNPICVNPDHLFLGTHTDNMRDIVNKGRWNNQNSIKTHCKRGHEFTKENTYLKYNKTRRECKTCAKIYKKKELK